MVNYTDIEAKLQRLDTEYNNSILDPDLPIFYSKLAVIEFSGWMEDSVDSIVYEYIDNHILDPIVKQNIKNNINSNTQVSKIEVDAPKENTKFKMSEFISPVYGRMEPKLNYPTIPNLDEKQKSISQLDDEEFLSVLKAFRQNL